MYSTKAYFHVYTLYLTVVIYIIQFYAPYKQKPQFRSFYFSHISPLQPPFSHLHQKYKFSYTLSIHPCYRQLQNCRYTNPCEIRNVGKSYPFDMRINSNECPDESDKYEQNIYRCEEIVLETKLKIGKSKIEYEIECKRQSDYCREFLRINFVKYSSIRYGNNSVQYCPHWPKEPRWWCPRRFDESAIPIVCV